VRPRRPARTLSSRGTRSSSARASPSRTPCDLIGWSSACSPRLPNGGCARSTPRHWTPALR
jgi:hypothetical protein